MIVEKKDAFARPSTHRFNFILNPFVQFIVGIAVIKLKLHIP